MLVKRQTQKLYYYHSPKFRSRNELSKSVDNIFAGKYLKKQFLMKYQYDLTGMISFLFGLKNMTIIFTVDQNSYGETRCRWFLLYESFRHVDAWQCNSVAIIAYSFSSSIKVHVVFLTAFILFFCKQR